MGKYCIFDTQIVDYIYGCISEISMWQAIGKLGLL